MEIDYLKEMGKARHEYYKIRQEFRDILDEWEETHQKMGYFSLGINFDHWNEIRVVFYLRHKDQPFYPGREIVNG